MRVALVSEWLWKGGATVYMERLAAGLVAAGHEVVFVTLRDDALTAARGFEVVTAKPDAIPTVLHGTRADLYHYHSGIPANNSFDAALESTDVPVVETMHSFGVQHHITRAKKVWVSKRQAGSSPWSVIPPGFPPFLVKEKKEHKDGDLVVGMMGGRSDMGVEQAVRAISRARKGTGKEIWLRIFGCMNRPGEPLVHGLELPYWVLPRPWMYPTRALYFHMSKCDGAIHAPARPECWSQAVCEWMLMGIPVILNQQAAFDITDGNCIHFNDDAALYHAILDCLDPEVRHEVGVEGLAAAKPYTIERCAGAYLNLYGAV